MRVDVGLFYVIKNKALSLIAESHLFIVYERRQQEVCSLLDRWERKHDDYLFKELNCWLIL